MAHQGQLISAINQYCKNKFGPGEYLGEAGVCNGISGYVLLKHAAAEIDKFTKFVIDFYEGIAPLWQVRQFVEEVKLLQGFSNLLSGIPVQQPAYHYVFNFLLSPTNSNDPIDIMSPPEEHKKSSRKFDFGLLMTRDEMASVLAQILKPGYLVSIGSHNHAGFIYVDEKGKIYAMEPNQYELTAEDRSICQFDSLDFLVSEIIEQGFFYSQGVEPEFHNMSFTCITNPFLKDKAFSFQSLPDVSVVMAKTFPDLSAVLKRKVKDYKGTELDCYCHALFDGHEEVLRHLIEKAKSPLPKEDLMSYLQFAIYRPNEKVFRVLWENFKTRKDIDFSCKRDLIILLFKMACDKNRADCLTAILDYICGSKPLSSQLNSNAKFVPYLLFSQGKLTLSPQAQQALFVRFEAFKKLPVDLAQVFWKHAKVIRVNGLIWC